MKKKTLHKFNPVSSSINWCAWSWNPVTGCKYNCSYCYAKSIALRFKSKFPYGFKPHFYKERLSAPACTKIPKKLLNVDGIERVFVGSMADLFGPWVPKKWINKILKVIEENPQWIYIFMTKNPSRYLEFNFPETALLGATGTDQKMVDNIMDIFEKLKSTRTTCKTFLSCDPLLEKVKLPKSPPIDWIAIGGQTKTAICKKKMPELEWVTSLEKQALKSGVRVYSQPSLDKVLSCIE